MALSDPSKWEDGGQGTLEEDNKGVLTCENHCCAPERESREGNGCTIISVESLLDLFVALALYINSGVDFRCSNRRSFSVYVKYCDTDADGVISIPAPCQSGDMPGFKSNDFLEPELNEGSRLLELAFSVRFIGGGGGATDPELGLGRYGLLPPRGLPVSMGVECKDEDLDRELPPVVTVEAPVRESRFERSPWV
ncbi:hypothetical protein BCR41DRAFT_373996 [Lobosporangium transversale]|uniref:Uncharacterized protein n=1 Tax=Lobosporangium transversale TaxID=64571 RepID=A0A1Y2GC17_9FUNG|nr:hypothetical protein BCR41DRAFT_373996 [Lobosporangium transversale]ORZ06582.1 hypothetical protein BCR41DRAFT_373996 [Lobosporangium transversale]|eukprot:XP_021877625.1 hypothetical protein BCR41DRAFT_373996 [Lobosporangium transversale]